MRLTKLTTRAILLIAVIAVSTVFVNLAPSVLAQQYSSTTISYSPQPAIANSLIEFNATVFGYNPIGRINWITNSTTGMFNSTSTALISGTSNVAFNDTSPGNITIIASYGGDANNKPNSASLTITIYSPIDFNHEGKVDFSDLLLFVGSYINFNQNGQYNVAFDLNCDGSINFNDVLLFLALYEISQNTNPTPVVSPITYTPTPAPITYTPTPTPIPTTTPRPTPMSTSTSYSYIMTTSGSNYQILNSANTLIESSTSSSVAFNWLLGSGGHAASGSNVYVESGTYLVDSSWRIYLNSVTVTFQSGAVLAAIAHADSTNQNDVVLTLNGNNIILSGVTINGNGLNQQPSPTTKLTGANFNNGITYSGNNDLVQNSTVYNVRDFGIVAAYGQGGNNNGVINSTVYNCGANAISSDPTSTNNYFVNNVVYGCSDVGISSQGLSDIVTGNTVYNCFSTYTLMYGYQNSYWGIGVEGGSGTGSGPYLLVAGNKLTNNGVGIWVNSGNYILISGNTLANCNLQNYGAAIDINLNAAYNIIEYNTITNAPIAINLEGTGCTSNIIYGNTYNSCITNFVNAGTRTSTSIPSIVTVTVLSSPAGTGYITANGRAGYASSISTSPYTFYATVGDTVTLSANNVSGYAFTKWSDGGAQTHTITVPSTDVTYTATY